MQQFFVWVHKFACIFPFPPFMAWSVWSWQPNTPQTFIVSSVQPFLIWDSLRVLCNCEEHLLLCPFLAVPSRYPTSFLEFVLLSSRREVSWASRASASRCGGSALRRRDSDWHRQVNVHNSTRRDEISCLCGNVHIEPYWRVHVARTLQRCLVPWWSVWNDRW